MIQRMRLGTDRRAIVMLLTACGLSIVTSLFSGLEARSQTSNLTPRSYINGGLLGESPFKASPDTRSAKEREEDWSIRPSNAEKYAEEGVRCLRDKNAPERFRKGLAYFTRSIECYQTHVPAYYLRGVAYFYLNCLPQALEDFEFVISKWPDRDDVYAWRALIRALLAREQDVESLKAAERDLERAVQAKRIEGTIRGARGIIAFKRQEYRHAVTELSSSLEQGSGYPRFRYYRAQAYIGLEEFLPAIADLEELTKQEPSFFWGHYLLGLCHFQMDKPELALVDYENAVKLQPENLEVLFEHIALAFQLKKHDVALADLDRLVALNPKAGWAYCFRGLVGWIEGKDMARVRSDVDRAAELGPHEWCFHACRAVLQYKRTEYDTALGSMARCGLTLRRTEFTYSWQHESYGNGHGRFQLEFYWNYEGEKDHPEDGAKPADLDHKFVDMGLKALWASWLNSLKVN